MNNFQEHSLLNNKHHTNAGRHEYAELWALWIKFSSTLLSALGCVSSPPPRQSDTVLPLFVRRRNVHGPFLTPVSKLGRIYSYQTVRVPFITRFQLFMPYSSSIQVPTVWQNTCRPAPCSFVVKEWIPSMFSGLERGRLLRAGRPRPRPSPVVSERVLSVSLHRRTRCTFPHWGGRSSTP